MGPGYFRLWCAMAKKKAATEAPEQKPAETAKPMGRPTIRTPEMVAEIFSRMAEGKSLRTICRDDNMPSVGTILRWVGEDKDFQKQYEAAMEQRAEALFEEMFEIADETNQDTISTDQGDRPNAEWISRSRLRVDVRKWALSKMVPKKYGDKIQHTGDGGGPVQVTEVRLVPLSGK